MAKTAPRFLPAGESAVVVELGDAIDPELNARVLALDRALREHPFEGYLEAVPTYRSLLLFIDPDLTHLERVREHVSRLEPEELRTFDAPSIKEVPTVYDGEDLDEVARLTGLGREDVIRLHSGREYRAYMLGFTPGFAYLGTTHEALAVGRRATPRTRVPAGSVAIAKGQTAVYPSSTPGGWHLIGRAEHRDLFDPRREPPSRFLPGDRVRFVPVEALPSREIDSRPPAQLSSSPALEVEEGGLLTTVQDLGRPGYQRFGVPVAGAIDAPALWAANRLVGNAPGAAVLECTVSGPTLRCLRSVVAAVTGADLGAVVERSDLGEWEVPPWTSFLLRPGNALRFDNRRSGARAYVAVGGGIDVPEVLGSRSTYLSANLGGFEGRALRTGDRLGVGTTTSTSVSPGAVWPGPRPIPEPVAVVRVVLGPQDDHFTEAAKRRLTSSVYVVGESSDRMGCRLDGPELEHRGAPEIVSDGMMLGAVQVPPDGRPIVMLADRATTGGYPKIATVVSTDVQRLGQLLPGEPVRFRRVFLEEARRALAGSNQREAAAARALRG